MASFGIRDLLSKLPSQLKPAQPDFLDALLSLADLFEDYPDEAEGYFDAALALAPRRRALRA